MFQIRSNVFETNSSSTHSISISNQEPNAPDHIYFWTQEYGGGYGEFTDYFDLDNYLYTAICVHDDYVISDIEDGEDDVSESDLYMPKFKAVLDLHGISYDMSKNKYGWYYIDDNTEMDCLLDYIFGNEDLMEDRILRALSPNSFVKVHVDR